MEALINGLVRIAEIGGGGAIIILSVTVTVCVLALAVAIYKLISFLMTRRIGVKLGDKEINLNDPTDNTQSGSKPVEGSNPLEKVIPATPQNTTKFFSTITQVVNYSIENGYANCKKRHDLFDSQMSQIRNHFDMLTTFVLDEYQRLGGQNLELIKIILRCAIEDHIVSPLRHICIQDRLAEKSKDQVIELNRSFINTAYSKVRQDIQGLADHDSSSCVDKLLDAIDRQKDLFKREIVDCLDFAHSEAENYLAEVHENNKSLDGKINNTLKVYFEDPSVHEVLPTTWISDQSGVPPNNVIGGSQ